MDGPHQQKAAAEMQTKAGFSKYMDKKVREFIKSERAAREMNQKFQRSRFVFILQKFARECGIFTALVVYHSSW